MKNCNMCYGKGYNMKTRMVQDYAMGLALGTAIFGGGMFPRYRSESYQERCIHCNGSGKRG